MLELDLNSYNVEQPLLFRIKFCGKTSYLFGTCHILSTKVFSDEVLTIFDGCKSIIVERISPTIKERILFRDKYLERFSRRATDIDWYQRLSKKHQSLVQTYFDQYWQSCLGEYAPNVRVGKIQLSIVENILISHLVRPLMHKFADANLIALMSEADMEDEIMMNFDLDNIYGLEDYFSEQDKLTESEDDLDIVNILLGMDDNETYSEDLELLVTETIQESKATANDILRLYRDGSALTDFADTLNRELRDKQNCNMESEERNQIMFKNMLIYMQSLPTSALFAVGFLHLIGRNGLLMQLSENGIKVELFNPRAKCSKEQFIEYVYPYKYYLRALESLKNTLLSRQVECTNIIPYQPAAWLPSFISHSKIVSTACQTQYHRLKYKAF